MSFQTMYPAKINSPITTLAYAINDSQTSIEVADISSFPAAPNIAVISPETESAETLLYTGISGSSLTGITRAFEGTAAAWDAGTQIARAGTAYDLNALRLNIEELKGHLGEVRMFLSISVPADWLLLDGSTFSETTYPDLYTLLGDSNTLPDFRDRFVRAWGTSRDPGDTEADSLKAHTHTFSGTTDAESHSHQITGHPTNDGGTEDLKPLAIRNDAIWNLNITGSASVSLDYDGTTDSTGDTETRPANIAVVFAIYAK